MKKLISFGCSWTFGVAADWDSADPETRAVYKDWLKNRTSTLPPGLQKFWTTEATTNSARALLSKEFNLENINWSFGRKSNYYNFRKLREFFVANKNIIDECLILFGITSTARNEYFDPKSQEFVGVKYDINAPPFLIETYDHNNEVRIISENIFLWNDVFSSYNVPVIWYDTFNTHNYPHKHSNVLPEDLLSLMLKTSNVTWQGEKFYHLSSWKMDDPRITHGVKHGLLNPISFHPTKQGQALIAEILKPYVSSIITRP